MLQDEMNCISYQFLQILSQTRGNEMVVWYCKERMSQIIYAEWDKIAPIKFLAGEGRIMMVIL